jgi:hypothetical protein
VANGDIQATDPDSNSGGAGTSDLSEMVWRGFACFLGLKAQTRKDREVRHKIKDAWQRLETSDASDDYVARLGVDVYVSRIDLLEKLHQETLDYLRALDSKSSTLLAVSTFGIQSVISTYAVTRQFRCEYTAIGSVLLLSSLAASVWAFAGSISSGVRIQSPVMVAFRNRQDLDAWESEYKLKLADSLQGCIEINALVEQLKEAWIDAQSSRNTLGLIFLGIAIVVELATFIEGSYLAPLFW